jgi:hypothetical protein
MAPSFTSPSVARDDQQMNELLQLFLQVDGDDDQSFCDPSSLAGCPREQRGALKRLRGQAGGGQGELVARAAVTGQSWSAAVMTTTASPPPLLTAAHDLHLYAITMKHLHSYRSNLWSIIPLNPSCLLEESIKVLPRCTSPHCRRSLCFV